MCRKRNPHAMQANDIYEGSRSRSFIRFSFETIAGVVGV